MGAAEEHARGMRGHVLSSLSVRPVRSQRDRRLFLRFAREVYRDDALWEPPLHREQEGLLGFRPHPFHHQNEVQPFLALRGDRVVGRIAAIQNRQYNEYHGDRLGFFGFFECRDDLAVARALYDAAGDWLAGRGLVGMLGPLNPSIYYGAGVLVEGHDLPPAFLMPHNPRYYDGLFVDCGFCKAQDLFALATDGVQLLEGTARIERVARRLGAQLGLQFRTLDRSRLEKDLLDWLSVFNISLREHWAFVPLAAEELQHMAAGLRWLLVPDLVVGGYIADRLAGVAFAVPDYHQLVRKIHGRLFPLGFIRLLAGKRRVRRFRVWGVSVLPEFHKTGLAVALVHAVVKRALELRAEEIEFSWIAESNPASHGPLETGGARRIKTYRVYNRS
jgi:hypothetical protein